MTSSVFKQKLVTAQMQSQSRDVLGFTRGVHLSTCKVACDFWTMPCLIGLWNLFTGLLLSVGIPRSGVSRGKPYAFGL